MKNILKKDSILYVIIPLILSFIGILFIFSTGQLEHGNNTNLYLKQLLWVGVGIIFALFIVSIDYYYIVETSFIYYILGIILLVFTLLVGKEIKGAKSWLGMAGLGIQASEVMKICYILFYAKFLSSKSNTESNFRTLIFALGILIIPLSLVLLQPDLGTSIVFISIFITMTMVSTKNISIILQGLITGLLMVILTLCYAYYQFYYLANSNNSPIAILDILLLPNTFFAIATILLVYTVITFVIELFQPIAWINKFTTGSFIIGISFLMSGIATKILKPYQWSRLLVFINPEFDRLGAGYNIIQAQIAIGSGGFSGQGFFNGTQNLRRFLPEKHTDFIYAIIAEETGFIGSFLVVFLYIIYFSMMIKIIFSAKDIEGSFIATGIFTMFAIHTIINIGMNLGIAPVTGLPLPFISYGGSSYITFIIAAALLLNIYNRRFIH